MIRLLYNLLFPIALVGFLPAYLAKMMRRGQYGHKFSQRLGFYDHAVRARLAARRPVWIHAVSVGEVNIALKLAGRMKEQDPELRVALTTTTTTGFGLANRQAPDWMEVLYTPLDFWPVMRCAFAVINPRMLVLVEAELWPNQIAEAHARGIPVALVNARLSPRSERRFRRFRFLLEPTFRLLDLIGVQEREDVARWQALGVHPARIRHLGSIKFDTEEVPPSADGPRQFLATIGIDHARPILLAGSTHPGEEEILANVFVRLRRDFPALFLIVAPRHVERTREVTSQLEQLGLRVQLRTNAASGGEIDAIILNSTGELRDWYAIASVVFVGKSFTVRGGQNPVEPIVAGSPVVFGPHMENFAALADSLVNHHGAVQARDEAGLEQAIASLLRDPDVGEQLVQNAREVLAAHRGATLRTVESLAALQSAHSV
jgi:3-deoxy-D-manno-octulosonic-acid transferase